MEFIIVLTFSIIFLILVPYMAYYFVCGDIYADKSAINRLQKVLHVLDESWRISLLVLVPLLYGPIRIFFRRVENLGGMQAGKDESNPGALSKSP